MRSRLARRLWSAVVLGFFVTAFGTAEDAAVIRTAITGGRRSDFKPVLDVLTRTGALEYSRQCAMRESEAAAACVAGLPPSPHRQNLLELAAFAASRTY